MADTLPSQVDVCLRVPIEVWEHVIEAAYNERYGEVPVAFATLCSCALVCRVWRPCAQKVLFNYVVLRDKAALYRFAELVDAYPKLGTYVRMLALRGYLHVPYSPAVLFLTALGRRLTNLSALSIHGFDDDEKAAHPLPEGHKELPCLPFHRYFPSLLTSVSHIRRLSLRDVRFASFGDFARFLSALCNLGDLFCTRISWSVLGVDPACFNSGETFLPNLRTLLSYDRLLSGLGASLCEFRIKFPNNLPALRVDHPDVKQETPSLALDLRYFPRLDRLICILAPFPHPDKQTHEPLRDTLLSWVLESGDEVGDISPRQRCLCLVPAYRDDYTREEFVALLRTMGPIVEGALCRKEIAGVDLGHQVGEETDNQPMTDPCRATLVVEWLSDRLEWEEWWRTAIAGCFPTLSRWNRLHVDSTNTRLPTQKWRDYDETPQDYDRRRRKQYAIDAVFSSSMGRPSPIGRRRASI